MVQVRKSRITTRDLLFVIDLCKMAITKADKEARPCMHPLLPGGFWDKRRTLEVAYYLLNLADQNAKKNMRLAEGCVSQAVMAMAVYGVEPEKDDEAKALLNTFSLPAGKKPS